MLLVNVPRTRLFNEETSTFSYVGPFKIQLEHSLVSISKWESVTHKAFLGKQEKTRAELMFYIECMIVSSNNNQAHLYLSRENIREINNYMDNKATATIINKDSSTPTRDVITSEYIYYLMISANIPFECQKWHLNRLLTLIELCAVKSGPSKPRSPKDTAARYKALNEARKARLNTRG